MVTLSLMLRRYGQYIFIKPFQSAKQRLLPERIHLADDESNRLGVGVNELVAVSGQNGLTILGPLHAWPRVSPHLELQHGRSSNGSIHITESIQDLWRLRLLKQNIK